MKKLKIIIPVLLVIAAVLAVAAYLILGNKIAITGKGKVQKGLAKSLNSFEEDKDVLTDFEEYKYMKNIDSKPFETEVKFNIDADIEGLDDIDKDIGKLVEKVVDELADANITMKMAMDKANKQLVYSLDLDAEKIIGKLTGEAVITDKEITFRSNEINKNFLTITKEDAEDKKLEEVVEMFDMVDELFARNFSDLKFSAEEIQHFKDTYGVVLENTITDDMITSEKGEFVVDGNNTNCTVTIVNFNNENVKKLLGNYVTAYKEDKEGKEILTNKFTALYGKELTEEMMDSIDESIEEIEDEIAKIEGASIDYITYGTATEVYGNEYKITIDEETLDIVEKFNSDNKSYTISFEDEEIVNATVKKANGEFSLDATVTIEGTAVKVKFSKTKDKLELSAKLDNVFDISIKADINTKTNTDKELAQDVVLNVDVDVPIAKIKGNATIKMNENLKIVDSIDVPDTENAVSLLDDDKLEKYADDASSAIEKLTEKFTKSDLYKAIEEYSSSKYNSYSSYNYDDYTWDDSDYNYSFDDDYSYNFDDDYNWNYDTNTTNTNTTNTNTSTSNTVTNTTNANTNSVFDY